MCDEREAGLQVPVRPEGTHQGQDRGRSPREIYGADGVDYAPEAEEAINLYIKLGYNDLPICMAKTQASLSDDKTKIGRPRGWRLTVREVRLSAGSGFIVPVCGKMMTMPGLPKHPGRRGDRPGRRQDRRPVLGTRFANRPGTIRTS